MKCHSCFRHATLRWWATLLILIAVPAAAHAAHVNVIELDNRIVSPVTQQYIVNALHQSEREQAECLVLVLDTPGGLLESTRAIVKAIMNARVPVVVYVGPSGARAGSAGVFITLASHIAAMAPSTNIGAAHPVGIGGEDGGPVKKLIRRFKGQDKTEEEIVEETPENPMADKIMNDTVAWVTTIARSRHRNEDWAMRAVTQSVSATEAQALEERVVELIAKDLPELLRKIDGWPVEMPDGPYVLSTAEAPVTHIAMSKRDEFLSVITNPTIAYLLMLLGTLGLVFEFTHPGIGFPGVAGLMCVILALYAFQTLPTNYAALALMGLGLALLVAEVKVVSYGLLTLGGVIALTLGSLLLFDSPSGELQVSLAVVLPMVLTLAGIVLFVVRRAVLGARQPVTTGAEGLIGVVGTASIDLNRSGLVFVHGELWNATANTIVRQGERVRVTSVDGLQLVVEKVEEPGGV